MARRHLGALLIALAFAATACTDSPPQDEADAAFADALAQSDLHLAQPPELDLEHDTIRNPEPFWRANVTVHLTGDESPEKTEALLNDVQLRLSSAPEIEEVSLRLLSEDLVFGDAQPTNAAAYLSLIPVVEGYQPYERASLTETHLELTTAESLEDIADVFELAPDIGRVQVQNIDDIDVTMPSIVESREDDGEPLPHPPYTSLILSREEAAAGTWFTAWEIARSVHRVRELSFSPESRPTLTANIHGAADSAEEADTLWPLVRELLVHHDRVDIVNHTDERGGSDLAYTAVIPSCSADDAPRAVADGALYEELTLRAEAEC